MRRSLCLTSALLLALALGGCTFIDEKVTIVGDYASKLGSYVASPFRSSTPPPYQASAGEIMEAKLLLRALHYDVGPDDETLDPKTRAAIQQFETVKWATPDMAEPISDTPPPKPSGDVTPELLESLDRATAAAESLTAALSKVSLVALGFDADCTTRQLDERTVAAIQEFERQENLPVDGQISERLYESLKLKKRSLSHPVASIKQCTVIG